MCRALIYLGRPALLDNLLFQPDSSLVKQTFMPRMLHMLNLAGFGMMAWDGASYDSDRPFRYSSPTLPVFDRNLKDLSVKIQARCLLAHVRGVPYTTEVAISHQNTHPFCFPGYKVALAHNGDLHRFGEMKGDLLAHIRPEIMRLIGGSTDSEWIYAVLLSQLDDPKSDCDGEELRDAVEKTLRIIREARHKQGLATSSSINLFITNGAVAIAVRYCFDFGCYRTEDPGRVHEANMNYLSLWYTTGREFGYHEGEWKMVGGDETADSLIIASEPLTHDTTTWLEVPEYSLLYADTQGAQPTVANYPLDI